MTIEPFKVQGMTFYLDRWEHTDPGIWTFFFDGEKLDRKNRLVTLAAKVPIQADTETEAWEKLQGLIDKQRGGLFPPLPASPAGSTCV